MTSVGFLYDSADLHVGLGGLYDRLLFFPAVLAHNLARRRSIIYIDGFNLYYGVLKGGPNKWLDLDRFCRMIRKDDDIQRICYFTARVAGPDRVKQETYLRAIQTTPLVELILGRFKSKTLRCGVQSCTNRGQRLFRSPEEKETDVNIALHMLDDAYQDRADLFVLVSGDSDLVPAISYVKTRFPLKQVIAYAPTRSRIRGAATQIRTMADKARTLPLAPLSKAQFPVTLPNGQGGTITKPAGW